DVKFFGDTASAYMLWDASADDLILGGAAGLSVNGTALVTGVLTTTAATVSNGGGQFNGAINVGVDDTGYDVKFFGATSGAYMHWDQSADDLVLGVGSELVIGTTASAQLLGGGIYIDSGGYAAITLKKGASNTGHAIDFNDESNALQYRIATNVASGGENLLFCNGATPALQLTAAGDLVFLTGSDILTTTLGSNNIRIGLDAGDNILSGGNQNVAVGDYAGTAITTGDGNTAVGYNALASEDTGGSDTAIGHSALANKDKNNDTFNTALGHSAGISTTSASANTFIGGQAGYYATTAQHSVFMGYNSGFGVDGTPLTGDNNVAIGSAAGKDLQGVAHSNVFVGHNAGTEVTVGFENTLIGHLAGDDLTNSDRNTAVGAYALHTNTLGQYNTAVGYGALNTANHATATNAYNVAVGYSAGQSVSTGTNNTLIGGLAGDGLTTAANNTAVGYSALSAALAGTSCTAIGLSALALATGNENTALGVNAGNVITSGTNNLIIGVNADPSAATSTNQMVMGREVTGSGDNTFTFGAGTSDSAIANGADSISQPSDQRYKEEIADATAGLAFIKDLRPVTFKWKKEKDLPTSHRAYVEGSETRTMNDSTNHGFIAQEVKTAIDAHSEIKDGFNMWSTDDQADGGRQRLAGGALVPILVKAIQEQNALIEALTARIAVLEG
ncbi:hypothetical protein pfor_18c2201, partial [Rhodobacteraceae bacterium SB2]